jgi:hypothetical protein
LPGQLAEEPVQTRGAQDGAPVAPSGSTEQVPFVVAPAAVLQASQAPAQATLQQTLLEQKPLVH